MNEEAFNSIFNNTHSYGYDKIESPIEEFFLNHIIKYISPDTKVKLQLPLKTISGNFRADIALLNGDKTIIIECDGQEHHTEELDDWYDEWRDTLILFQNKADTIYRITGKDIYNNINSIIYLIYYFEPVFFDKEYSRRLDRKDIDKTFYKKRIYYDFVNEDGKSISSVLEVKRKNLDSDFDRFWLKYIMYSILNPDNNIHELIEIMSKTHLDTKELLSSINIKYPKLDLIDENQLLTIAMRHG